MSSLNRFENIFEDQAVKVLTIPSTVDQNLLKFVYINVIKDTKWAFHRSTKRR
jgi:hypothetical protein